MTTPNKPGQSRVRPGLDTPFHIDYEWWKREDQSQDLRAYLISQLLPDQRKVFENGQNEGDIDWIDPDTAEVRRIDALQQAIAKAAQDAQWITNQTTLVDAVFRVFVANGNKPLSPNELSKIINKPANTILRTLGGATVYKGLRPVID